VQALADRHSFAFDKSLRQLVDTVTIPWTHSLERSPGDQETVVSKETREALESVLEKVNSGRRHALKRLLAGASALALIPASTVLAEAAAQDGKKGDGSKKGRGKKGDGKKGDGEAKKGAPADGKKADGDAKKGNAKKG
jgi:hypothetical protein